MSHTATIPAPVATDAPLIIAPLDGAPMLAAALAAVDASTGEDNTARATLAAVILSRFAFHADHMATVSDGVKVLPRNYARVVQGLVWRDGTGSDTPTPSAERTPALTSLGQYLSRAVKVATDASYGLPAIATVDGFRAAEAAIKADAAASRENEADIRARAAAVAYDRWVKSLPAADRDALTRAASLLTGTSVGISHAPAFIATVTPVKK